MYIAPTQGIHNNSQTLAINNPSRKFNKFAYPIHVYHLANCRQLIKLRIKDVMRYETKPVA